MNMKRILPLFFAISIASLVLSCATYKPIAKRLIGTWKNVKIEPFITPGSPRAMAEKIQYIKNTTNDASDGSVTIPVQNKPMTLSKEDLQQNKMILSEVSYNMTLNANKTAVKESLGKTIHARWKLKDKGTDLFVDSKETGRQMIFHIFHLTDTSAVFTLTAPLGQIKITYKKEKK